MTYESFQALLLALWSEKASLAPTVFIAISTFALLFALRKAGARLTSIRLSAFLTCVTFGFLLVPLHFWFPFVCFAVGSIILIGITFVTLCKYSDVKLHRIERTTPGFCFVHSTTQYALRISDDEIEDFRYLEALRRHLNKWLSFELLASNSNHHSLEKAHSCKLIPPFCSKSDAKAEFAVQFVLRGIDKQATLFCRIKARGIWGIICPWEIPIELKFPAEEILSEGFLRSQRTSTNTANLSEQSNPVSKETLFASDHFLHLGPYQPGEKLSLVHFPASLRLSKPVSRKFSAPSESKALVALGFGRRVKHSGTAELCISAVGQILAEHRNAKVTSDIVVFDIARFFQASCSPRNPILQVARNLCQLTPGTEEEDEFCVLEELGQNIRSYQVVRFVLGSSGSLDFARLFAVARLFRKNGVRVVASVFIPELFASNLNKSNIASSIIQKEMALETQAEAARNGVELLWCRDFKSVSRGTRNLT